MCFPTVKVHFIYFAVLYDILIIPFERYRKMMFEELNTVALNSSELINLKFMKGSILLFSQLWEIVKLNLFSYT